MRISCHIYKTDGLIYIIARENDTYKLISKEFDISERKLRRYNEVPRNMILSKGDIVYFQYKKSKVESKAKVKQHTVKGSDTMHAIAQKNGMHFKSHYKQTKGWRKMINC